VQQYFGIGCGLEDVSFGFHLGAQLVRIGDVAVMRDGNLPPLAAHQNRLGIRESRGAGGAVSHVPDARKSLKFVYIVFPEERRYKPHGFADTDLVAIGYGKASAFLTPVLQCVKSHSNVTDDVIAIIYTDNTAFLVQFVEHKASLKCIVSPTSKVAAHPHGCKQGNGRPLNAKNVPKPQKLPISAQKRPFLQLGRPTESINENPFLHFL
jgi:hypothetical protein